MNPWRAPRRVGPLHRPDEINQLARYSGPANGTRAALTSPVPAEAAAVPGDDRLWLHHEQRVPPPRPHSRQHDPAETISSTQLYSTVIRHRTLTPDRRPG